eukprot:6180284-Pleurochrysis_carterae.AAC.3
MGRSLRVEGMPAAGEHAREPRTSRCAMGVPCGVRANVLRGIGYHELRTVGLLSPAMHARASTINLWSAPPAQVP